MTIAALRARTQQPNCRSWPKSTRKRRRGASARTAARSTTSSRRAATPGSARGRPTWRTASTSRCSRWAPGSPGSSTRRTSSRRAASAARGPGTGSPASPATSRRPSTCRGWSGRGIGPGTATRAARRSSTTSRAWRRSGGWTPRASSARASSASRGTRAGGEEDLVGFAVTTQYVVLANGVLNHPKAPTLSMVAGTRHRPLRPEEIPVHVERMLAKDVPRSNRMRQRVVDLVTKDPETVEALKP